MRFSNFDTIESKVNEAAENYKLNPRKPPLENESPKSGRRSSSGGGSEYDWETA